LFAIRIILDTPVEHEKIFLLAGVFDCNDYYTPNPDRLRDWISTPKGNGYESLHTTVMAKNGQWVEVQIRTKRMDEIAERDMPLIGNIRQRSQVRINLEKWLMRVRETLENRTSVHSSLLMTFAGIFLMKKFCVHSEG